MKNKIITQLAVGLLILLCSQATNAKVERDSIQKPKPITQNAIEQLRYNFQVDDEFVVRVRTYQDLILEQVLKKKNHTNKDEIYRDVYIGFKPVEKKGQHTRMEVKLKRILKHYANYVYDTQSGFPALDDEDLFFQYIINKPFDIWIKDIGEIERTEGLKEVFDNAFKYLESIGSVEQLHVLNRLGLNTYNLGGAVMHARREDIIHQYFEGLKGTVQYAFPLLGEQKMETEITKWLPKHTLGLIDKSNYKHVVFGPDIHSKELKHGFGRWNKELETLTYMSSDSSYRFRVPKNPKLGSKYFIRKNGKHFEWPIYKTDTLIYSNKLGRFVSGNLNKDQGGSHYYINLKARFRSSNFATLNPIGAISISYGMDEELIKHQHVSIVGNIQNNAFETGSIYLWSSFPDSELFKKHEFIVNEDGGFNIEFQLTQAMELTLRFGDVQEESSIAYNLFIEPGDSIQMVIDANENNGFPIISGNSIIKHDIAYRLEKRIEKLQANPNMSLQQFDNAMDEIILEMPELEKNTKLSIDSKRNLKSKAYFGTLNALHSALNRQFIMSSDEEKQLVKRKWFEKPKFKEYACFSSIDMRQFIHTKGNTAPSQNEADYYAMSYAVHDAIRHGNYEKALTKQQEFSAQYPETKLVSHFNRKLGNLAQIQEGKIAPYFSLISKEGKNIALDNYKGKWVYLFFTSVKNHNDISRLRGLNYANNMLDDKRFVPIVILIDKEISSNTLENLKQVYSGILLFNPDWHNLDTQPYNALGSSNAFLINPKGEFDVVRQQLFRGLSNSLNVTEEKYLETMSGYIKDYMDIYETEHKWYKVYQGRIYWSLMSVLFVGSLIWLLFWYRNRQLKQVEIQKREKVQLELKAIRSQLNPHFMFNTLNSIQHLISKKRNGDAELYISEFSTLMRQVLHNSDKLLIPLEEELRYIETYLKLEALRFGFSYSIKLDEKLDIYNVEVPGLLVQPFVENAVIHGISAIREEGNIILRFYKEANYLMCEVDDNGLGYYPTEQVVNGKGIALSKQRLKMVKDTYNTDTRLEIVNKTDSNTNERGTLVKIYLELEHE